MWPKTKQCNNSVRSTHFIVTDNVCNWVWQRQGNESQCETLLWCLNIVQFSPHFPFSFFVRSFISCSLHLLLDQLSNCWLCDAKFVKCTTEHERISRNQKQKSANETKWNFSNKLTIAANIHSQTHTHTLGTRTHKFLNWNTCTNGIFISSLLVAWPRYRCIHFCIFSFMVRMVLQTAIIYVHCWCLFFFLLLLLLLFIRQMREICTNEYFDRFASFTQQEI